MKIGIIGAGLTGLVAAKELKEKGFHIEVFEKLDQPGGRMRTAYVDGWSLDVGFQVMLTAYPYLSKHIDFSPLALHHLEAGATIFREGKRTTVGDPFRTKNMLFSTVFSDVGSFKDKWLIFKLKLKTDRLSIEEIFNLPNESSLSFLIKFGFSKRIIDRFFNPFFSGIFLEDQLATSARMLLFVFKMFAEGHAAIPYEGIGKVAKQLVEKNGINIHFNSNVQKIQKGEIALSDGTTHHFDLIINTIPKINKQAALDWNGCHNLYFEHESPRLIKGPRIGLNANNKRWINNFFYPSSIMNAKPGKELLSVTVVNDKGLDEAALIAQVEQELNSYFGLSDVRFLKHYFIPVALPKVAAPSMQTQLKLEDGIVHAGDYLLNGSQNAACYLGEEIASFISNS